jgi:hypothetical protein
MAKAVALATTHSTEALRTLIVCGCALALILAR